MSSRVGKRSPFLHLITGNNPRFVPIGGEAPQAKVLSTDEHSGRRSGLWFRLLKAFFGTVREIRLEAAQIAPREKVMRMFPKPVDGDRDQQLGEPPGFAPFPQIICCRNESLRQHLDGEHPPACREPGAHLFIGKINRVASQDPSDLL
jgi:hypothetical protein